MSNYIPRCLRNLPKKPRRNIDKEVRAGKVEILDRAIQMLNDDIRSEKLPDGWLRGHYAALSKLKRLRDEFK